MNQQTLENIPAFIKQLRNMSDNLHMYCDPETAADVSLKTNKAIDAIEKLSASVISNEVRNTYLLIDKAESKFGENSDQVVEVCHEMAQAMEDISSIKARLKLMLNA